MKQKQYENLLDTLQNVDNIGSSIRALKELEKSSNISKKLRKEYYTDIFRSLDDLYEQVLRAY